jgi:hypothetical protein
MRGVSANAIEGHCKTEIPPMSRTFITNSAKGIAPKHLRGEEASCTAEGANQLRPHQKHKDHGNTATITI